MQVDVLTSALPTGAATAANQSTANSALAAIQTAVEILDNAISGTEMQVDVVTSALPTGAATAANQSTANGSLSTIAGAVAGTEMQVDVLTSALPTGAATAANQSTANSALSAIQTAVEILDNAISGNEMQVDVVAALPAGTNNIGDVDVASVTQPGTVSTGQETVAVTAGQFNSGTSKVPVGVVTVKALSTNSGIAYIGPSGVSTSTGHALEAGDAITLEIDNLNKLYSIGTASDVLTWMCNTA